MAAKMAGAQTSATAGREYASAMDKIRDEMAGDSRRYIQIVGDYLTDYLTEHPEAEAAILKKDKSIGGSLKAMEAEARKIKEGSVGILDDATAFGIVLDYYGIKRTGSARKQKQETETGEPGTGAADPFDLDALMGGDVW